jgi:hypothetical protein
MRGSTAHGAYRQPLPDRFKERVDGREAAVKEKDGRGFLEGILSDAAPGDKASVQSQGQAEHPHGDDNHVDGWGGTKQEDGSVSIEKLHAKE